MSRTELKLDHKKLVHILNTKRKEFLVRGKINWSRATEEFLGNIIKDYYTGRRADDRGLNVQSGRLRDGWDKKITVIKSGKANIIARLTNDTEYGEIHETGGVIPVTEKARGFFWYMFRETQSTMWKAMALSKEIHIPKRSFVVEDFIRDGIKLYILATRKTIREI